MRKLVAIALAVISSAISSEVLAQSPVDSERFIDVGANNEVILLDRTSIKNNRFQLVLQSGDGYQIEQYQVVCSRKAYSLLNVRIYDGSDRLTTFLNQPTNPRIYGDNSPIGRAAAIVCQNR